MAAAHAKPAENLSQHVAFFIAEEFPLLRKYLGALRFEKILAALMVEHPTLLQNPRWLSSQLPHLLSLQKLPPEIAELATLERAHTNACAAADAPGKVDHLAQKGSLSKQAPALHGSVQQLSFKQNTTAIWSALVCGEKPPAPFALNEAQRVVVWRHGNAPRFRLLGEDEAALLTKISGGFSRPADVAQLENYVTGWREAGILWPEAPLK